MAFSDLFKKLFSSKSSEDFKELSDMTENEIEELGKKVLKSTEEGGKKSMEWIDKEGNDLFEKGKQKFKELQEKGTEELREFLKQQEAVTEDDLNDLFGEENMQDEKNAQTSQDKSMNTDEKDESSKVDDIEEALKEADEELEAADELIKRKGNLQALEDTNLIDDDFIEKARRYADSTLSSPSDSEKTVNDAENNDEMTGFDDRDGDGDYLIDDAVVEEE